MIQADNFDYDLARESIPALRELKRLHEVHLDTDLPSILDEIIEGFEIVANDYESGESQRALDAWMEARYPGGIVEALHSGASVIEQPELEESYKDAHQRAQEKVDRALLLLAQNFRKLWC